MRSFVYDAADGLKLQAYAWEAGEPRAALCIIHGLGEHAGRYAAMAERLNAAGIGVYSYDQRGHGRSPSKRAVARLEQLSGDAQGFVNLIRAQTGLPTVLFGHSMGGGVGLYTLLFHTPDVVAAIITSPWLRLAKSPPRALFSAVNALPGVFGGMHIRNGLSASLLSHDEKVNEAYARDALNHSMVGLSLAADMTFGGERSIANAALLPVPLLLMHGGADGICSVSASREFAANAGDKCLYREFEGQFHELHNEPAVLDQVYRREIEFISEML